MTAPKFPTLDEVLKYTNIHVIRRYEHDFHDNKLSSKDAFREMLKFLWCAEKLRRDKQADPANTDLDFTFFLHHEMREIDDMWHTFILFTKDYMEFGMRYFGHYVHHAPTTDEEKSEMKLDKENMTEQDKKQLSYIYDNLGKKTLEVWFAECLK